MLYRTTALASLLLLAAPALPVFAQDDQAAEEATEAATGAETEAEAPAAETGADEPAAEGDAAETEAAEAAPAEGEAAPEEAPAEETPAAEMITEADASTVIATVGGAEITLGQLIIAKSQLSPQYQALPAEVLFDGVLSQLIQQQLLAGTVADVPDRVQIALDNQRRSLLAGEAITQRLEEAVSEEAIRAAYDEAFANTAPALEYNASHILVDSEEAAQAVLERLAAGEAFADLAVELSSDPGSGSNGGQLGWFGAGMMVEPFQLAVEALEAGAVSEPVETQFGWHIIQLNETREQTPPAFEEVAGEIEAQLQQEAIEGWLAELEAATEVSRPDPGVYDPNLINALDKLEP